MNEPLSTQLYWESLPSPVAFLHDVARAVHDARAVEIHLTKRPPTGTREAVADGVRKGFTLHQKIVVLDLHDGQDVAQEIRANGGGDMSSSGLLALHQSQIAAVVLRPRDDRARAACALYFEEFIHSLSTTQGNARLVVLFESDRPEEVCAPHPLKRTLHFNGMLSRDEMRAYVAVRMIGRAGPADTRLIQSLVSEFAGFDPMFAEKLIAVEDDQILSLPDSLAQELLANPSDWRESSWGLGTAATTFGSSPLHTMRHYYISRHDGPDCEASARHLRMLRWSACVDSLMPWLERRRAQVLRTLSAPIDALVARHGGKWRKLKDNREEFVDRNDIEFGDLTYLTKTRSIILTTSAEKAAVDFCWKAKQVRDEIAHLRPPAKERIMEMLQAYERLRQ